ncbi:hypothetical protein D3C72_1081570 [compost metagenome]
MSRYDVFTVLKRRRQSHRHGACGDFFRTLEKTSTQFCEFGSLLPPPKLDSLPTIQCSLDLGANQGPTVAPRQIKLELDNLLRRSRIIQGLNRRRK